MGASNWAICPRCKGRREAEATALIRKADEAYGKVPRADWAELDRKARWEERQALEPTLREDHEIYGAETGTVTVSYGAHCETCGLKLEFKTQHQLPVGEA